MTLYPEDLEIVPRRLQPGEIAEVLIAHVVANRPNCVPTEALLLEAPNWAPDGRRLRLRSWVAYLMRRG